MKGKWLLGYPIVKQGSKGVYVCVLQDGLTTLGYNTGGLDGIFGTKTYSSVRNFQSSRGLVVDGIVGTNTWKKLMTEVVGYGASSTTIN
jgi:peptidoglycan hydrolase-like protein with peptidoglycan-binding domain